MRTRRPIRFDRCEWTEVLGFSVPVATNHCSRLLGLALLRRDHAGDGLLIPDCRSVHTFGMRFPLDLLFLDERGRVIELRRGVGARRIARCPAAAALLELPSPEGRFG